MRATNPSTLASRTIAARKIAAACGAGVLLFGVTACGSESPTKTAAAGSTDTGSQTQVRQPSGTSGEVAAVSGSTAQVQSQGSGQVAVSWTKKTTFTKQVAAKLADVKVGDCVMVTAVEDSSADSSTAQTSAVTAASVRITEPVDGSCTPAGGIGGVGGGPRSGSDGGPGGGTAPQGTAPDGAPGGTAGGTPGDANGRPQFRSFGGAFGTVKATSATGFTVTTTMPGGANGSTSGTSAEVAVTVSAKTTYSTTATGSADDVKVGSCLRADGDPDDTGAVTATTIALTQPVDGACGMTFTRSGSGSPAQAS